MNAHYFEIINFFFGHCSVIDLFGIPKGDSPSERGLTCTDRSFSFPPFEAKVEDDNKLV